MKTSWDSRVDPMEEVPCPECGKPTLKFVTATHTHIHPCQDCYDLKLTRADRVRRQKVCTGIYSGPLWRRWVWDRVMSLRWWLEHTVEPWLARVENYW
jgi:hypothetical protein